MSYTKNTLETGDTITAAKLNHMEDGINDASGMMFIDATESEPSITWQDVHNAITNNKIVIIRVKNSSGTITEYVNMLVVSTETNSDNTLFMVCAISVGGTLAQEPNPVPEIVVLTAESADGILEFE